MMELPRILCAVDFSPPRAAIAGGYYLGAENPPPLRGATDLFFFGSTTHHVIREGHYAVLTVRG